jgi:predicted nucleotidyltransferase
MQNNLAEGILEVCSTLNTHSVQYIIVGGAAVALHGYFRLSVNIAGAVAEKPDLDFWYNPTYDNYFRLLNALEALGQDVSQFREEQTPEPLKSFFKYEFEQFTLDMLPKIKATIKFKSAFAQREIVMLDKVEIPFIGFEDLIADKEATGRPKDKEDILHLRNIREAGE